MRGPSKKTRSRFLVLESLILLIVAVLSYLDRSGFIKASMIDAVSAGMGRMLHNLKLMQRRIESWKVAEA